MVESTDRRLQDESPIDLSSSPDLRALAEQVQGTRRPRILQLGNKAIARIVPIPHDELPETEQTGSAQPHRSIPTLEMLRRRKAEILAVAANNGALDIKVFGSVARGEATPSSDIDFLVELAPDRTVYDLSSLILDLQDLLGFEVQVVEAKGDSYVAQRIQREAVSL